MHRAPRYPSDAILTAVEGGAMRIRVLLCDDSRTRAAGLRRLLECDGQIEVVGVYRSVETAIEAIPHVQPDLVTLDVELPGIDAAAAVERVTREHALPVIVLSSESRTGLEAAAAARAAGAAAAYRKHDLHLGDPLGLGALVFRRRVQALVACATPALALHLV
jgi:chemotaxis response regulator CheB